MQVDFTSYNCVLSVFLDLFCYWDNWINKSRVGDKCSHTGHSLPHRLMAAVLSGISTPLSMSPWNLLDNEGDYHPLEGMRRPRGLSPLEWEDYHLSLPSQWPRGLSPLGRGLSPLFATSFGAPLRRPRGLSPLECEDYHLLPSQRPRAWSPLERGSSPLFARPVCLCPCMRRWSIYSPCPFTPQVCCSYFCVRAKGWEVLKRIYIHINLS